MSKNLYNLDYDYKYIPYDIYGKHIDGINWYNLSYNKNTGMGTFLLKFEKNAKTIPHIHEGYEEYLVLEGELIDNDGEIYKKGDFVINKPGSHHFSYSNIGCRLLVTVRGYNRII